MTMTAVSEVGARHIDGGRKRLRRALYTAVLPASFRWNPHLIALYQRLRAAGKEHKSALIACARKLLIFVNTVVARGTPWQDEHASNRRRRCNRMKFEFLGSTEALFLRPDLPPRRRRAQTPSRMAVVLKRPRTPLPTGHALTAASKASCLSASGRNNRPQSIDLMVATKVADADQLPVLVHRLALLDERRHALGAVLQRKGASGTNCARHSCLPTAASRTRG